MIEEALVNYGVLGLWTISLLAERYLNNKKLQTVIENNSKALVQVYEVVTKCKK